MSALAADQISERAHCGAVREDALSERALVDSEMLIEHPLEKRAQVRRRREVTLLIQRTL